MIGDPNFATSGGVLIAREMGGAWDIIVEPYLAPQPQMFGSFGSAVAIRGNRVVVGEPERAAENGAIYDFQLVGSLGEPCGLDSECASGACCDGICCDSDCGESQVDCQKCSSKGQCQWLVGDMCLGGAGCNHGFCEEPSPSTGDG